MRTVGLHQLNKIKKQVCAQEVCLSRLLRPWREAQHDQPANLTFQSWFKVIDWVRFRFEVFVWDFVVVFAAGLLVFIDLC